MNTVVTDEFNYIPQTFKGGRLVINYKNSAGGQNTDNTITEYQFGDGASNLTYITAKGFKTSETESKGSRGPSGPSSQRPSARQSDPEIRKSELSILNFRIPI